MNAQDDEHRKMIEALHEIAGNIRTLAREIEGGRTEPVERFDYLNNATYEALLSPIIEADFAEAEDCDRPPTEALRARVNPLLAGTDTTIDALYADARTGRMFVLRNAWNEMQAHPQYPEHASGTYDSLHYSLKFLGIEPRSPEMYELLQTDEAEFTKLDKEYALSTIYEEIQDNHALMSLTLGRLALEHAHEGEAGEQRIAEEFQSRVHKGLRIVLEDIDAIKPRSGVQDFEIMFYVNTRFQMDGLPLLDGPAAVQ